MSGQHSAPGGGSTQQQQTAPNGQATSTTGPPLWDAADVLNEFIEPRQWLLGNVFCKGFTSSLVGAGAAGKTALRIVQGLSIAAGCSLTGEFVHKRAKVLFLSFEDGETELKRRVKAALLHYKNVLPNDLRGWMTCMAFSWKLFKIAPDNSPWKTEEFKWLQQFIEENSYELIILDPFIKIHSTNENDNSGIEQVVSALAYLAVEKEVAVDFPHHVRKGSTEPGDAEAGRGASAAKDAGRLGYTLTPMTKQMADICGVKDEELRRSLVRMDSAKVNIARPTSETVWFQLVSVALGNATQEYPSGDHVQTVERWYPPDTTISPEIANQIFDVITNPMPNGRRYSGAPAATDRAAWPVVQEFCPTWTEDQCRRLIHTWLKPENQVLLVTDYFDPVDSKKRRGLFGGTRPGSCWSV